MKKCVIFFDLIPYLCLLAEAQNSVVTCWSLRSHDFSDVIYLTPHFILQQYECRI